MTTQMKKHAQDPAASSFLSFTYDPSVAYEFAGKNKFVDTPKGKQTVVNGGYLAVRMDERRLLPNLVSAHGQEVELLAALVIFPDEIVKYHEGDFTAADPRENFYEEVRQKTGVDFFKDQEKLYSSYVRNGRKFFNAATQASLQAPSLGLCSAAFTH